MDANSEGCDDDLAPETPDREDLEAIEEEPEYEAERETDPVEQEIDELREKTPLKWLRWG